MVVQGEELAFRRFLSHLALNPFAGTGGLGVQSPARDFVHARGPRLDGMTATDGDQHEGRHGRELVAGQEAPTVRRVVECTS